MRWRGRLENKPKRRAIGDVKPAPRTLRKELSFGVDDKLFYAGSGGVQSKLAGLRGS
jgi:hypothetical protein